jgi:glycosyltransferase involved in cell wall biosynthesis
VKILMVLRDLVPTRPGGTELHVHRLAQALVRRGDDVLCLHSRSDPARLPGTWIAGELEGVRTLARVHAREPARSSWIETDADQDFDYVLGRERPDVVHFQHLDTWGPRCLVIAREHGARVVMTLHDYHALCARGSLCTPEGEPCARGGLDCTRCLESEQARSERREHFKRGLAQAHSVIAPSRFLVRTFTQAGFLAGTAVEILSPGTHGALHRPRQRKGGRLRLGFLGGSAPEEGLALLLAALQLLPRAPLELHVHGAAAAEGAQANEPRPLAQGPALHFHGPFDARHVDALYAGFDVLVAPSLRYEDHPLAIQDAFRCGLTVLASELGGVPEFVQDGINGLLFPRGDARALARCLERLLGNPALYERLCRDRPRLPSMDEVAQRVQALYARAGATRVVPLTTHASGSGPLA